MNMFVKWTVNFTSCIFRLRKISGSDSGRQQTSQANAEPVCSLLFHPSGHVCSTIFHCLIMFHWNVEQTLHDMFSCVLCALLDRFADLERVAVDSNPL